jgi:hypothetical protein
LSRWSGTTTWYCVCVCVCMCVCVRGALRSCSRGRIFAGKNCAPRVPCRHASPSRQCQLSGSSRRCCALPAIKKNNVSFRTFARVPAREDTRRHTVPTKSRFAGTVWAEVEAKMHGVCCPPHRGCQQMTVSAAMPRSTGRQQRAPAMGAAAGKTHGDATVLTWSDNVPRDRRGASSGR